jgi:hypothetical protein
MLRVLPPGAAFLEKPITLPALASAVRRVLDRGSVNRKSRECELALAAVSRTLPPARQPITSE